ncbi:hypothetical protein RHMOL_Rhmol09G0273600 [Rhododendron molle]|uniref:Uncharacterized protein n=1 Tax=Rhododendron molle TaxID=49168 RepID=A0ACC0MJA2_RHOML|nr:hypothetical protein RHMOL_Rhmol09G0273600 [Rhododendron molle]
MAANSRTTRGVVGFAKRFLNQIIPPGTSTPPSLSPSLPLIRRAVHVSVYDKNVDDQVRPTVVPDEVIEPQSDKYWAPHPQTGVFGPDTGNDLAPGGESSAVNGGEDSVLEQKAFFRPLEDLEKPMEDLDESQQP